MILISQSRPLFSVLAVTFLCSCGLSPSISEDTLEHNRTVEKFSNAQVLLNILRASDRRRMVFTALTQIRGDYTRTTTGNLSLEIPFGGDAESTFPLTPSLSVENSINPSFDVGILDSKEFASGILQPIDLQVAEYYWQQRWPQDMLLYLLIHKVEHTVKTYAQIETANGVVERLQDTDQTDYFNQPWGVVPNDNTTDCNAGPFFTNFSHWINCMQEEDIVLDQVLDGRPIGPSLTKDQAADLDKLIKAEKDGLRLVKLSADEYQLCKVASKPTLCFGECEGPADEKDACTVPAAEDRGLAAGRAKLQETRTNTDLLLRYEDHFTVHIRGVQGMIYYLGEIVRWQADGRDTVTVRFGRTRKPAALFVLSTGVPSASEQVASVDYKDTTYFISETFSTSGYAKTALTLITQLLALFQERKELPTTTAVSVVGQ